MCEDCLVSARSRTVIIGLTSVALLLGVVVSVAISYTAAALSGCQTCHLAGTFAVETEASRHAGVACVDCHVDGSAAGRIAFATRELFHMVIPLVKTLDRSYAAVPSGRCATCHTEVESPGVLGARGLKIQHLTCIGDSACTDCHSATAHGGATRWLRLPQMEDCYRCHGVSNDVVDCDSCHAERRERQRVFDGPFRVTHGPEWRVTHGMGDMRSCSACHDEGKCGVCHGAGVPHGGAFLSRHAEYSTASDAQCTSCHRAQFCESCHAYPMPHDVAFITGHSAIVAADGEAGCLTCHVDADCAECHVSHVHPVTEEQMDSFLLGSSGPGGDDR